MKRRPWILGHAVSYIGFYWVPSGPWAEVLLHIGICWDFCEYIWSLAIWLVPLSFSFSLSSNFHALFSVVCRGLSYYPMNLWSREAALLLPYDFLKAVSSPQSLPVGRMFVSLQLPKFQVGVWTKYFFLGPPNLSFDWFYTLYQSSI